MTFAEKRGINTNEFRAKFPRPPCDSPEDRERIHVEHVRIGEKIKAVFKEIYEQNGEVWDSDAFQLCVLSPARLSCRILTSSLDSNCFYAASLVQIFLFYPPDTGGRSFNPFIATLRFFTTQEYVLKGIDGFHVRSFPRFLLLDLLMWVVALAGVYGGHVSDS